MPDPSGNQVTSPGDAASWFDNTESAIADIRSDIAAIETGDVETVNGVAAIDGEITVVAADIGLTPTGDVTATDVQAGVAELASEKASTVYVDSQDTGVINFTIATFQPLDADLTALAAAGNSTALAATSASFASLKPITAMWAQTPYASRTASTLTLNRLYFTPLLVTEAFTTDLIGCDVATVGGTTASVVMNLYTHDAATCRPLTKIGTDVTFNTATGQATGERSGAFAQSLTPGVYWLAIVAQGADGATPTLRCGNSAPLNFHIPSTVLAGTDPTRYVFQASVSGTLPATTSGLSQSTTAVPIMGVRRA